MKLNKYNCDSDSDRERGSCYGAARDRFWLCVRLFCSLRARVSSVCACVRILDLLSPRRLQLPDRKSPAVGRRASHMAEECERRCRLVGPVKTCGQPKSWFLDSRWWLRLREWDTANALADNAGDAAAGAHSLARSLAHSLTLVDSIRRRRRRLAGYRKSHGP